PALGAVPLPIEQRVAWSAVALVADHLAGRVQGAAEGVGRLALDAIDPPALGIDDAATLALHEVRPDAVPDQIAGDHRVSRLALVPVGVDQEGVLRTGDPVV